MEWCEKMIFPIQWFWARVASRFRFRNNGLSMLQQEVKECEYEDVQIMWEMLTRSETELARYPARSNRVRKLFRWARLGPCLARPL